MLRAIQTPCNSTAPLMALIPLINRVLVANRGESAIRVMNTAKKMGIESVSVFSDADRNALFVKKADRAYHIGPPRAAESYLNMDKIINTALKSNSQAVHPGYGFLSENAIFADKCAEAGLVFIEPPAQAIRDMGAKNVSQQIMEDAKVPVVRGFHGKYQWDANLRAKSEEIGYPMTKDTEGDSNSVETNGQSPQVRPIGIVSPTRRNDFRALPEFQNVNVQALSARFSITDGTPDRRSPLTPRIVGIVAPYRRPIEVNPATHPPIQPGMVDVAAMRNIYERNNLPAAGRAPIGQPTNNPRMAITGAMRNILPAAGRAPFGQPTNNPRMAITGAMRNILPAAGRAPFGPFQRNRLVGVDVQPEMIENDSIECLYNGCNERFVSRDSLVEHLMICAFKSW